MGGPKALLSVADDRPEGSPGGSGRTTFLARGASLLARPGVASVVAVLGAEAGRVAAEAGVPAGVRLVVNERYLEGMLTSIARGLDEAEREDAEAVLLHLVDHPLVAPATVDRVGEALERGARIAVPTFGGRRGHPAGFARDVWPELRAASAARGARGVLADHPERVVHVEGDPGCVAGIDTPDDYRRLLGCGA